jgi:hypothetical protein
MNFDINTIAYAEHCHNVENAVSYLIDLAQEDIDPFDAEIFASVMKRYGLVDDGFIVDINSIIGRVQNALLHNC